VCSVLFYFCSQCVTSGEVKPLTMHRREAADLFSAPRSRTARPRCHRDRAAALARGQTRGGGDGDTLGGGGVTARCPPSRLAEAELDARGSRPRIQISGHFLLRDFQLRGLGKHDEPSAAETATEQSSPLRTPGRTRCRPPSATAPAPAL